jgi:hypothetical protein
MRYSGVTVEALVKDVEKKMTRPPARIVSEVTFMDRADIPHLQSNEA